MPLHYSCSICRTLYLQLSQLVIFSRLVGDGEQARQATARPGLASCYRERDHGTDHVTKYRAASVLGEVWTGSSSSTDSSSTCNKARKAREKLMKLGCEM